MSKHTKGPWSVPHMANSGVDCNCAYVLAEGYMGSICTISVDNGRLITDGGNDSPPLVEAQANANLIASAPDLLEALEYCLDCLGDEFALPIDCIDQSTAAIKKAKGE